jgi:hypothetical protein
MFPTNSSGKGIYVLVGICSVLLLGMAVVLSALAADCVDCLCVHEVRCWTMNNGEGIGGQFWTETTCRLDAKVNAAVQKGMCEKSGTWECEPTGTQDIDNVTCNSECTIADGTERLAKKVL